MKANMGIIDKVTRVLIAIAISVLYFTQLISGTVAMVLMVIALVLVVTSMVSFCPLYFPFGVHTCREKKDVN